MLTGNRKKGADQLCSLICKNPIFSLRDSFYIWARICHRLNYINCLVLLFLQDNNPTKLRMNCEFELIDSPIEPTENQWYFL